MQLIGIKGLPIVKRGDDLGELIMKAAAQQGIKIEDGDVIAVAQCVVSKAEGAVVDLRTISPSKMAKVVAAMCNKEPRTVEVILQQSSEIVRLAHVIISRTKHGFICANAGVDYSNIDPEHVTVLPEDPDASAARIREYIKRKLGADVAVIVTDTHGRPFKLGCVGAAIGVAGMNPLLDLRGRHDLYGKELQVTITAPADAIAAAAVAVMGESDEGMPVVLVKEATYQRGEGNARDMIRPRERDLFR